VPSGPAGLPGRFERPPCFEQGPAHARPDRELPVLASRFTTLSVPLGTAQQHRPAAPGRRRALDAYINAPSACGAASAGAAAGRPTGAAAAPAAAAAGTATPLVVEAAATRADAAATGIATSAGDAAAAGSSFTTCSNMPKSTCRTYIYIYEYVCNVEKRWASILAASQCCACDEEQVSPHTGRQAAIRPHQGSSSSQAHTQVQPPDEAAHDACYL